MEALKKHQSDIIAGMKKAGLDEKQVRREISFAKQIWDNPKNEYLRKATPESVAGSIVNVANIGLTLNPVSGEAYLVPRYDKCDKKIHCHLEPSYKGFFKLLTDAGTVTSINPQVVYEGDEFDVQLGLEVQVKHIPFYVTGNKQGEMKGVYCVATLPGGEKQFEYMTVQEIHEIRNNSESWKSFADGKSKSAIWNDWGGEMARKTVVRRIYKYLPRSCQKIKETERIDNAIGLMNENFKASMDQLGYINSLLRTSTLTESEIERIEIEMGLMTSTGATETIQYLSENQHDLIESADNYNQSDIHEKLDLKMEDEKS